MELLDMVPAHAIALRVYSLPAAAAATGSLCAWLVAALAAAVGLWRIRTVGAFKPVAGVRSGSAIAEDKLVPLSPRPAIDEPQPAARVEPADEPASPSSEPSTPDADVDDGEVGDGSEKDGVGAGGEEVNDGLGGGAVGGEEGRWP
ncbi:hypothetical protein PR202_gb22525 [Eleusine coracana subsp. coracana]|uniref:Uncharacterized protein n=1 Tax=Eleusine coracana subsp. coracana TaxID=191504 RepID=A0AAV5FFX3_ELECO|nr:hypothetical protein PR202_gb22525 [Eleusine coracana subsp. coracana]